MRTASWKTQLIETALLGKHLLARLSSHCLLLIICIASSGCAGMVARAIPESQRVQDSRFDGMWTAQIRGGGGVQFVGSQGLRCTSHNLSFSFSVRDGKLSIRYGLPTEGGAVNVSSKGKFRMEIPTTREWKGGNFNVQKPGVTYVVQGDLSENTKKGVFVVGMEQLNNEGCSSRIKFINSSADI